MQWLDILDRSSGRYGLFTAMTRVAMRSGRTTDMLLLRAHFLAFGELSRQGDVSWMLFGNQGRPVPPGLRHLRESRFFTCPAPRPTTPYSGRIAATSASTSYRNIAAYVAAGPPGAESASTYSVPPGSAPVAFATCRTNRGSAALSRK